jgi:FKBP-type peptidyl-prolyl cis-trans isomerase FkpA
MNRKSVLFNLVLVITLLIGLQVFAAAPGDFKTTATGLKYKFITQNEKGKKPVLGDFVTVVAYYKAPDTIFFDSRKSPTPYIFPIMESTYKGDLFEGLQLMSVGDSAIFELNGDSLMLKTFRVKELPKYVKAGSTIHVHVKMTKIQPKDEFQAEMQAKFEADAKKSQAAQAKEDSILAIYLKKNNITTQPTRSGLIYIEDVKGTGPMAQAGHTVKVHYTGRLLDGTKFDSSVDRNLPFEFEVGKGKVIKGWDEGIPKMSVGGKARLIIPSKIAYGERGAPPSISPYSTLVFEVELLEVK